MVLITVTMVFFLCDPLLSLPGWVWPNILIADSIGSNLCSRNPPSFSKQNGPLLPFMWFIFGVVAFTIVILWMSLTTCFCCQFYRKYFSVTYSNVIFPDQWQANSIFILFVANCQNRKKNWQVIWLEPNQEFQSFVWLISKWFNSTFYNLVFKFLNGGVTRIHVV